MTYWSFGSCRNYRWRCWSHTLTFSRCNSEPATTSWMMRCYKAIPHYSATLQRALTVAELIRSPPPIKQGQGKEGCDSCPQYLRKALPLICWVRLSILWPSNSFQHSQHVKGVTIVTDFKAEPRGTLTGRDSDDSWHGTDIFSWYSTRLCRWTAASGPLI